jgi:hypothetical protein
MRRTIGTALVFAFMFGALLVATAAAKTKKLDLTWNFAEHQLAPGEEFRMNNQASEIKFEVGTGVVTCSSGSFPEDQGFIGKDQTNDETTDKVEITEYYGTITGGNCASTSGLGSTSSTYFSPGLSILSLSGSKGTAQIKAKSKTNPISASFYFSGGDYCAYTATTLKGTLTLEPADAELNQVVLSFSKQKLKRLKGSSPECPKSATLVSAPFQFQTINPEIGYYIFGRLM